MFFAATLSVVGGGAVHAAFDTKTFLQVNVPSLNHEAVPHGVPNSYDWKYQSELKNLSPPNSEMTYMNIRGDLYVDTTNVRPANTRVEIANCATWGLAKSNNQWQKIIDMSPNKFASRGWKEDFSAPGDRALYTDMRDEAVGVSVVTFDGYNNHFYNNTSEVPLVFVGSNYAHFITSCSSRLILNNPAGADDRGQSTYIIRVGNDWKKSDNTCTINEYGATLCYGSGSSRFIKVQNGWRRLTFNSMNTSQINANPTPPLEAFRNPDGTYGDGQNLPSTGGSVGSNAPSSGGTQGSATNTPAKKQSETPAKKQSATDKETKQEEAKPSNDKQDGSGNASVVDVVKNFAQGSPSGDGISLPILIGAGITVTGVIGAGVYFGLRYFRILG
tara:strand:- start:137 stop:1297 length:1161 start_codon:yes stop_codon:yes gene_type:complete